MKQQVVAPSGIPRLYYFDMKVNWFPRGSTFAALVSEQQAHRKYSCGAEIVIAGMNCSNLMAMAKVMVLDSSVASLSI